MSRLLWEPNGECWEAVYHQAYHMWEILDPDKCPFSLHYAEFSGIIPETCAICGRIAEPAVRLRDPHTRTPIRHFGPFCLSCVGANAKWLEQAGLTLPDCLIQEA